MAVKNNEIVVKKSPLYLWEIGSISLVIVFFGCWVIASGKSLPIGLLLIIVSIFFFFLERKGLSKAPSIFLKFRHDEIWTPQRGYKPISQLKFYKISVNSRKTILELYRINDLFPDERIEITNMNISQWRLRRLLNKHIQRIK